MYSRKAFFFSLAMLPLLAAGCSLIFTSTPKSRDAQVDTGEDRDLEVTPDDITDRVPDDAPADDTAVPEGADPDVQDATDADAPADPDGGTDARDADGEEMDGVRVVELSGGSSHTCALLSSGDMKCWGWNNYGQIGNPVVGYTPVPVEVLGLSGPVRHIDLGDEHSCALLEAGGIQCWGNNEEGQLGDGTTVESSSPLDVVGLSSGVLQVSAGYSHTCARLEGGAGKCWGKNNKGQLGDGSTTNSLVPVDVSGLGAALLSISAGGDTTFSAGGGHTCAVVETGGVKCWGSNNSGQLGNGTTIDSAVPADVSGLGAGMIDAEAGTNFFSCALLAADGVKCWGSNGYGELGDGDGGTGRSSDVPVDVIRLSSAVEAISVGARHACALLDTGGIKCWGYNHDGQLGDGTNDDRMAPVDVSGLTSGVASVAAGGYHTCALLESGGVKCWGSNSHGQIGNGTTSIWGEWLPVDVIFE